MEIILTHLQINYPIWFQFLDIRYQWWEFGVLVCFPVESQVTLGITQQVLDPFARSGPRGKSKVAAKRPPWERWHGCTWHPRYSLRAMLEYCSASHDLRLLLCDDFKDYPRRGKFTQATRLKNSMSKAVSPCNSADITFISFPEPCGTNLAQESIDIYHAWQLHVLLGCCGIHFSHLISLNISAFQHSHEATHGCDEDRSTNGKLRFGKSRNLFNSHCTFWHVFL